MNEDRLRWVLRQMFKLVRQSRSRESELLRLYLELNEKHRQLREDVDNFLRPPDPTKPVN